MFFFFSSRRRHTRYWRDWSSDVCSSDLSLYIDMDYYNMDKLKKLTPEQIIYLLDTEYFKEKVPEASFIVITGRGIAIYWLIEPVPYMALPLWNAVQKFLLNKLEDEIGRASCRERV